MKAHYGPPQPSQQTQPPPSSQQQQQQQQQTQPGQCQPVGVDDPDSLGMVKAEENVTHSYVLPSFLPWSRASERVRKRHRLHCCPPIRRDSRRTIVPGTNSSAIISDSILGHHLDAIVPLPFLISLLPPFSSCTDDRDCFIIEGRFGTVIGFIVRTDASAAIKNLCCSVGFFCCCWWSPLLMAQHTYTHIVTTVSNSLFSIWAECWVLSFESRCRDPCNRVTSGTIENKNTLKHVHTHIHTYFYQSMPMVNPWAPGRSCVLNNAKC